MGFKSLEECTLILLQYIENKEKVCLDHDIGKIKIFMKFFLIRLTLRSKKELRQLKSNQALKTEKHNVIITIIINHNNDLNNNCIVFTTSSRLVVCCMVCVT